MSLRCLNAGVVLYDPSCINCYDTFCSVNITTWLLWHWPMLISGNPRSQGQDHRRRRREGSLEGHPWRLRHHLAVADRPPVEVPADPEGHLDREEHDHHLPDAHRHPFVLRVRSQAVAQRGWLTLFSLFCSHFLYLTLLISFLWAEYVMFKCDLFLDWKFSMIWHSLRLNTSNLVFWCNSVIILLKTLFTNLLANFSRNFLNAFISSWKIFCFLTVRQVKVNKLF